jgi:ABC-type transport system involved in multi-copper enzyme maturation permease subunit
MNFKNFLKVTSFTITDDLHYKSFYILAVISVLLVLMLRGCFGSDMMMNGQALNNVEAKWYVAIGAFHFIAGAGILFGVLLAMRAFKRDAESGMMVMVMARPVKRIEYILAKVTGVWLLSYGLTFILHLTVYLLMFFNTGGRIPLFMPASLLVSVNVLFAISVVMFFSLVMPDIIAALLGLGITLVSYISDSIYAATQTELGKSLMTQMQQGEMHVSWWRLLWPKIAGLQYFAVSIVKEGEFYVMGPVHPVINMFLYITLAVGLLYWKFSKEEIK